MSPIVSRYGTNPFEPGHCPHERTANWFSPARFTLPATVRFCFRRRSPATDDKSPSPKGGGLFTHLSTLVGPPRQGSVPVRSVRWSALFTWGVYSQTRDIVSGQADVRSFTQIVWLTTLSGPLARFILLACVGAETWHAEMRVWLLPTRSVVPQSDRAVRPDPPDRGQTKFR